MKKSIPFLYEQPQQEFTPMIDIIDVQAQFISSFSQINRLKSQTSDFSKSKQHNQSRNLLSLLKCRKKTYKIVGQGQQSITNTRLNQNLQSIISQKQMNRYDMLYTNINSRNTPAPSISTGHKKKEILTQLLHRRKQSKLYLTAKNLLKQIDDNFESSVQYSDNHKNRKSKKSELLEKIVQTLNENKTERNDIIVTANASEQLDNQLKHINQQQLKETVIQNANSHNCRNSRKMIKKLQFRSVLSIWNSCLTEYSSVNDDPTSYRLPIFNESKQMHQSEGINPNKTSENIYIYGQINNIID